MNVMRSVVKTMLLVVLLGCLPVLANSDSRRWTMASGDKFEAELISYDPKADVAVLLPAGGEKQTYSIKDFAPTDAAWLIEWADFAVELDRLMAHMKGEFKHYQLAGPVRKADFYVYTPSKYKTTTNLPLLMLFHPGGKGARYVKQFMDAAEALNVIVVSSDAFRNTTDDRVGDEMDECFKELFPVLEKTVAHDPDRLFMGGTSGGASRAYHYSGMLNRPWRGIFANGGWLGGPENYDRPYGRGMRIAMVNGNNDRAAEYWIRRDSSILGRWDSTINLFVFEGGHQVPPPMIQFKALQWMLDEEATPRETQPVGGLVHLPTEDAPPPVSTPVITVRDSGASSADDAAAQAARERWERRERRQQEAVTAAEIQKRTASATGSGPLVGDATLTLEALIAHFKASNLPTNFVKHEITDNLRAWKVLEQAHSTVGDYSFTINRLADRAAALASLEDITGHGHQGDVNGVYTICIHVGFEADPVLKQFRSFTPPQK